MISGTASDLTPNASGVSQIVLNLNGSTVPTTGTSNWTAIVTLKSGYNTIVGTAVDAAGNVSSPATVQVNFLVAPPANDFFANAQMLSGTSNTVSGSNLNATKEIGEPNIEGNAGGASVWWYYQRIQVLIL